MAHDHLSHAEVEEAALSVSGMNCASCVSHVERAARSVAGVQACDVNLARGRAVVRFDPHQADPQKIAQAITDSGYLAAPEAELGTAVEAEDHRLMHQAEHARSWLHRAIVGIALWLPVELAHWILALTSHHHAGLTWLDWIAMITSTIAIVYVGWAFYLSAFKALLRLTSNMDTLIAMGATVAYVYSLIAMLGNLAGAWRTLPDLYFMESTGLLALISLGHWLEARARASAGGAIHELMNLAPATALRYASTPSPDTLGEGGDEGLIATGDNSQSPKNPHPNPLPEYRARGPGGGAPNLELVPVADLRINDVVLVRPGDRVPIDGVVVDGKSSVDESMITGESLPVTRGISDNVVGGTINHDGALKVRVTRVGSQTALAQIIQLVEKAQASKPAVQKLADRIAAIFVPSVLLIALITAVSWYAWGATHDWESSRTWAHVAKAVCSVLIIACPCALGLAVPAALMVGTGRGAKRGILIRDIDALQNAEKIDTVVLDKTGTITRGKPVVTKILPLDGLAENDLLRLAAGAEQYSQHPLAQAIVGAARGRGVNIPDAQNFSSQAGEGVIATIDGKIILVGSAAIAGGAANDRGVGAPSTLPGKESHGRGAYATEDSRLTGSVVHIGQKNGDGAIARLGTIELADDVKSDSLQAVETLHRMHLRTILLTGDNLSTAEAIARQVGIDDVRAQVKPHQKAAAIVDLQNRNSKIGNRQFIAMVGDGINDAPALAQADLGIAIGSGSDIAKETGDIVLVGGSLLGIATAIRLSRATMRTVRQNLFLAFIYNILAIPIAAGVLYPAFGIMLSPLIAAAAMALSDVTVIGNALLLRRARID